MHNIWEEHSKICAFYSDMNHSIWKPELPGGDENLHFLADYCGVEASRIIRTVQTHSSTIRVVKDEESYKDYKDDTLSIKPDGIDGLVTDVPGILLTVLSADCVPVLMYDPKENVIAALHSGWRGTCNKISAKMIDIMSREYNCMPADIRILIGPHICGRHYEVGPELSDMFSVNFNEDELSRIFLPAPNSKLLLDMTAAITISCINAGVPVDNICDCGVCTYEDVSLSSYRRTGTTTDRILTGIMLK
ncbi:MAG: peptidoglycan editing factor PgeF [Lachnospiraceae bacterium]|nr:peptidoglycan editing factor PgeF [Lachnospiraceae bacterium]